MSFYTKTIAQTYQKLDSGQKGLSNIESEKRLARYGRNEISIKADPLWRKLIEPFRNIFMLVLSAAAVVSLLHDALFDAIIIVAIMLINAIIYYVQRFSTERVLRSLQKKQLQSVYALRDNQTIEIDIALLVPGDIILVNEGEKIPADARLVTEDSLRVDESQLTGESLPIEKHTDPLPSEKAVYERTNMIYQGSFVVGGTATAIVIATGNDTEFGQIAQLSSAPAENSPVQIKIDRLISLIVRTIALVAVIAFGLAIYRGMDLAESLRYVLALAVSAVPESLPIAITVVLVFGMRRMAKQKALVKAMKAIESIGVVTTIATDKTGTLTRNKLTVQNTWHTTKSAQEIAQSIQLSLIRSSATTYDPLDIAMNEYVAQVQTAKRLPKLIAKLPFDQLAAMSGNVYLTSKQPTLWVKGAPEHIINHCYLSSAEKQLVLGELRSMAGKGFRVIALAHTELKTGIHSFAQLPTKQRFEFDGLVAVADVLRPEAKHAIETARSAGIKVYMVTGDHYETAFHIGKQLSIVSRRSEVFDSRNMHDMNDDELAKIVETTRVFARVTPENKHRLLMILKHRDITAMTGDGVNDVPALAGAHVGVAMGSGASIAKDAGDIILLDDNFKTIVSAVHEGRTIYANIKRMVAYLLSTNAGEVFVAMIALVVGIPVPLVAVQILWVNLVTDSCLVIPLGLEPGEPRNMNKPPQPANAPLFSRFMITRILLVSTTMAILTLSIYQSFISSHGLEYARSLAFHALVVMQWASAFCFRSDYESFFRRVLRFSPSFYIGLFVAITAQIIALTTGLGAFLHITPISFGDAVFIGVIAFIVPLVIVEIHKFIGRRWFNKGHHVRPN